MNLLEEIKRLRALADMATPGPYKVSGGSSEGAWVSTKRGVDIVHCLPKGPDGGTHWENAEFIAASRTAIPELCDALEKAIELLRSPENMDMDNEKLLNEWGLEKYL
jgi:hypothetical protein